MKRILSTIALCFVVASCDQKKDEHPPPNLTCLDYATALLGMCFDAIGTEDVESQLQCDESLLEAGYNACHMALETEVTVCVPYRSYGVHKCSGYVYPPAPANWRGEQREPTDEERNP